MATKIFLRRQSEINADLHLGTNNANADGVTQGWLPQALSTTKGTTMTTVTTSSILGPTAGVEASGPIEWLSLPLAADVTISGTVTFNLWMNEAAASANAGAQCIIERINSQGAIASTVVNSEKGTELPTTIAAQNWTATPTSTAFLRGDRIRVRALFNDAGGTMASGSNLTMTYNGTTAAANGDTWIQFTETVTFETTDPTGTQLFLTDTSAGIDPGAATEKEAWTSRGAGSTTSTTNTATGWTAGIQITDSGGGTALEWYSKPLTAFTLGGKTKWNVRASESSLSANASLRGEIAICATDGSSPTVWGAACVAPITLVSAGELTTTDAAWIIYASGDDTAVTDGQRLRFRLYVDDEAGGALATAFTVAVTYAGTSAAAAGDTYVTLPQSVTEFVAAGVSGDAWINDRRTPRRRSMQRW